MPYWGAAQLGRNATGWRASPQASGYWVYVPRLRTDRFQRPQGRGAAVAVPALFLRLDRLQRHRPGGALASSVSSWPDDAAAVPDEVIVDLKARETGGLIDLPRPRNSAPAIACESSRGRSPGTSGSSRHEAAGAGRGAAGDFGAAQRVTLAADAVEQAS